MALLSLLFSEEENFPSLPSDITCEIYEVKREEPLSPGLKSDDDDDEEDDVDYNNPEANRLDYSFEQVPSEAKKQVIRRNKSRRGSCTDRT